MSSLTVITYELKKNNLSWLKYFLETSIQKMTKELNYVTRTINAPGILEIYRCK